MQPRRSAFGPGRLPILLVLALTQVLSATAAIGASRSSDLGPRVAVEPAIATTTTISVPPGWTWKPVRIEARISPVPENPPGFILAMTLVFPPNESGLPGSIDAEGRAEWSFEHLAPGDYEVYARFDGYGDYAASRSDRAIVHVGNETSIGVTDEPNPVLSSERPTITARLLPTELAIDGGELVIRDASTDTTLGTLQVRPDQRTLSVRPLLTAGEHRIRVAYSGHERFGPASVEYTHRVRMDATASIGPGTFYPVVDRFRDRLLVEGRRGATVGVRIEVRSAGAAERASAALSIGHEIPSATGAYRWTWDGTVAGGGLAPIGEYDVVVTLDDGGGNPKVVEKRIALSHDWVSWETKRATLDGRDFGLYGASKGGSVNARASAYPDGVLLDSGRGVAAVVYPFSVVASRFYGRMRFEVLGRSPNGHQAVIAIWNPALGKHQRLDHYDAARAIGPGERRWSTVTLGDGRIVDRKVRTTVLVWKGLGGRGRSTFDVRSVRLVYDVGTIHRVAATSAAGTSLRSQLRAALGVDRGRGIVDLMGDRRLPRLSARPEPEVAAEAVPDRASDPRAEVAPMPDEALRAGRERPDEPSADTDETHEPQAGDDAVGPTQAETGEPAPASAPDPAPSAEPAPPG